MGTLFKESFIKIRYVVISLLISLESGGDFLMYFAMRIRKWDIVRLGWSQSANTNNFKKRAKIISKTTPVNDNKQSNIIDRIDINTRDDLRLNNKS